MQDLETEVSETVTYQEKATKVATKARVTGFYYSQRESYIVAEVTLHTVDPDTGESVARSRRLWLVRGPTLMQLLAKAPKSNGAKESLKGALHELMRTLVRSLERDPERKARLQEDLELIIVEGSLNPVEAFAGAIRR